MTRVALSGGPTGTTGTVVNDDADVATGQRNVSSISVTAQGTATVTDRVHGLYVASFDRSGVVNKTITGAVTNGGLIRITCTGHTFTTGDHIAVYGVGGTTEANGAWVVTVIDANTFDLQGSTFTNAYTSGGTATNRPMMYGIFSVVKPLVSRGSLTGTAANGDDLNAYSAYNGSATDGKATDAFYLGHNSGFGAGEPEWSTAFACAANVQLAPFTFSGRITGSAASNAAIFDAGSATIESDAYAMRVPNNAVFAARNAANNANVNMFRLNTSNEFQIDAITRMVTGSGTIAMTITDVTTDATNKVAKMAVNHYTNSEEPVHIWSMTSATSSSILLIGGGASALNAVSQIVLHTGVNNTTVAGTARLTINTAGLFTFADGASDFAFGTTTGLKIGTATSQKFAFWNKTPIVQPTTGITGAAFVANSGTAVNDASTFGGYTLAKLAAVIINTGLAA